MKRIETNRRAATLHSRYAVIIAALGGAWLLAMSFGAHSEFKISGHVAYQMVDQDSEEDLFFDNNGYSQSRFRLAYGKRLNNGITVEAVEELGLDEADGDISIRRQELIFSGKFGAIRFGQGNDAGDGSLNSDFSGTSLIQPLASNASAVGYDSDNYNGFDPGRGERIAYDTPPFAGTVISLQQGEDNETEIALRFNSRIADVKLRVAAFATDTDTNDKDSKGALIAFELSSGFNFAAAVSSKDNTSGSLDGEFAGAKIGFDSGNHAFSLLAGTSENPDNPVETDASGFAYVYTMDKGIEIYTAAQEFDSDDDTADDEFVVLGARVKF